MKKTLTLLMLCVVVMATSCKKETVVGPGALTIFTNADTWDSGDNGVTYTSDVSVPEIDSYYEGNGAVLLYIDLGNGEYEQLPDVYGGITYRFTYTVGHVYIDAQNVDANSVTPLPPNLRIKIVLVQ